MRRSFVAGVLATLAVGAVGAALVAWSGVIDVGAHPNGPADRVLAWVSTQSVRRHARAVTPPNALGPAAVQAGLEQYKASCIACHGAPGAEPQPFAAGLHPMPPDLASAPIQAFSDEMLYWAIERGIGSTGMPAFGKTLQADQLWSLVAAIRQLPRLSDEQKRLLGSGPAPRAQAANTTQAPAGKGVHRVAIRSFKFDPPQLQVAVGDTVVWTNEDFVAHTATAKSGAFDTRMIDANQERRVVVKKAGEFPYYCRYHSAMTGTIVAR